MVVVLVLVSLALAITLGILMMGAPRAAAPGSDLHVKLEAESKARASLAAELDKRRKDFEEQRAQLVDVKEQLKQSKRKLFEQRETDKGGNDLVKARAEVERNASLQLESVRSELALALSEIKKLRSDTEGGRGRRSAPPPVAAPPSPEAIVSAAPVALAAPVEPAPRRFRELTDADRQKMDRLEWQASKERARSAELDRELTRLRRKTETQHRVYVVAKGEADLLKDKFKALEKRLNRTLLERDLIKRAITDLAAKTGMVAGRTELTADEIKAADQTVESQQAAEAEQRRAAEAKLHAEAERVEAEASAAEKIEADKAAAPAQVAETVEAASPPQPA